MENSPFDTPDKFLLIADLGQLRVMRFQAAGDDPAEKAHLVEVKRNALGKALQTVGEVVTDQAGKFGRGYGAGEGMALSQGEPHNLESELKRQAVERLSEAVAEVLSEAGHPQWILVAPQENLKGIEKALAKCCRERLIESIGADYSKEPIAKLEGRFL